jgi:hypothetical protein
VVHSDAMQAAWDAARGQSSTVDATQAPGHGMTTPLPASAVFPLPAVPAASAAAPAPATPVRPASHAPAAAAARTATPVPGTAGALHAAAVSLEMAPRALRAVSLADVSEPIPLTWIVRSGVVIGLVIVVAIVLAIAGRCNGSDPRPAARSAAGSSERAAIATPPRAPGPAAAPGMKPLERDAQLKLALRDLESGKTCGDRKAAVGKLLELRDPRAIPPLRRATVRTGPGDEGNACLKVEAEKALKELASKEPAPPSR